MTTPPEQEQATDLESYLRVHRALRASTAELSRALHTPVDGRRAKALARWISGFTGEIRCHHHIEDELLFPALAERVVTYHDDIGPLLQQDHDELDNVLDGLDTAAAAHDWAVAAPLAKRLDEHLSEHLDYEDRVVAGLFARHFTSEEFEELNVAAIKMVAPRQLLFTVPWTMSMLDANEQKIVLDSAPGALHVLWVLTRGRYTRRATLALGGVR